MAAIKKKQVLKYVVDKDYPEDEEPIHGYATLESAGIDIKAGLNKNIKAYQTVMVRTGIKVSIPKGYVGLLCSRSGLGINRGLTVAQGIGVIDSDYRGELFVPLYNRTQYGERVEFGDRIAQLLIIPVVQAEIIKVDGLDETDRGDGGIGSTGTK